MGLEPTTYIYSDVFHRSWSKTSQYCVRELLDVVNQSGRRSPTSYGGTITTIKWKRHNMDRLSTLLALCGEDPRLVMDSTHTGTVMQCFDCFVFQHSWIFEQTTEWPAKWWVLTPMWRQLYANYEVFEVTMGKDYLIFMYYYINHQRKPLNDLDPPRSMC